MRQEPKPKSICIVGHGPSLRGKGLGKEIDKFDMVIRMMNCAWQDEKDYGVKHEVSIHCPAQPQFSKDLRIPSFCYFIYNPRARKGRPLPFNSTYRRVPSFGEDEWLHELYGENKPFSRGTAATMLAMRFFSPQRVVLAGMTKLNHSIRRSYADHHPVELDNAHVFSGRTDTHDWFNERCVLAQETGSRQIKLEYLECYQN